MAQLEAIVIAHPDKGIFIGEALGLAFFSKEDPVGQEAAVAFHDEADARAFVDTWNPPIPGLVFHPVVADMGEGQRLFASVAACVNAGLEGWQP